MGNTDHKPAPLDQTDFEARLESLEQLPLGDRIKLNLLFWAPIALLCTAIFWLGWTLGYANGALRSQVRKELQCQQIQPPAPSRASNCPAGSIDTGKSCQVQVKSLSL